MEKKKHRKRAKGLYIISVAAELADCHPQTLRMYERKGLITPIRTSKNRRRYSDRDIEKLKYIQQLTREQGLNLAGVKMVFELEEKIEELRRRIKIAEDRTTSLKRELLEEIEKLERSKSVSLLKRPVTSVVPIRKLKGLK